MAANNALELFSLLESDKREDITKTSEFVQKNLYESKDANLLNALVDYYIKTRSSNALKILAGIQHQSQAMNLFDKLHECLKQSDHRLGAVNVLGAIVRQQPSWLYKIVSTNLFASLIRHLKTESSIVFLMSGVLIITTLLPLIPSLVGPVLTDFFEIFIRLAVISNQRSVNVANVYILHLQVALYAFFHRLYAMYPNNFIGFLQQSCSQERYHQVFIDIIEPMMEHVKLNPHLVVYNEQTETSTARWRKKEPHDILVECQQVSLDPLDSIQEPYLYQDPQSPLQPRPSPALLEKSVSWTTQSGDFDSCTQSVEIDVKPKRRLSDSATQTGKSLQDSGAYLHTVYQESLKNEVQEESQLLWSPTKVCRMTTPPESQDISPATSHWDMSVSGICLSRCSTPTPYATPVESPSPMLGRSAKKASPYKCKPGELSQVNALPHALRLALEKSFTPSSNKYATDKHLGLDERTSNSSSKANSLERKKINFDDTNSFRPITEPNAHLAVKTNRTDLDSMNLNNQDGQVIVTETKPLTPVRHLNNEENLQTNHENSLEESYESSVVTDRESGIGEDKILANLSSDDASVATSPEGASVTASPEDKKMEIPSSCDIQNFHSEKSNNDDLRPCVHDKSRSDSGISCQQIESVNAEMSTSSPEKETTPEVCNSFTKTRPEMCNSFTNTCDTTVNETATQERDDEIGPCVHLMSLALPYPSSMCKLCIEIPDCDTRSCTESMSIESKPRLETTNPSPLELLDFYIDKGTGLHYKQLKRIPLTSHPSINWTHFGGIPPPDEITILRDQIHLLHQQMLFERHKCRMHAMRNRRLVGKTLKANALEQANKALKDQLELKNEELKQVTMALNAKCEENRILKEGTTTWDEDLQKELRVCRNDAKSLKSTNDELCKRIEEQTVIIDEMKIKLQESNSKIFQLENKLEFQKQELTKNELLKSELDRVTGELIVMGELHQQHKDLIKNAKMKDTQAHAYNYYIQTQEKEIKASNELVHKQKAELEMKKSKLAELETSLSSKELQVKELKRYLDVLKGTYLGQLESLEEKYQALKKINQRLEAHIFSLYTVIDSQKETRKPAGGKSIARSISVDSNITYKTNKET